MALQSTLSHHLPRRRFTTTEYNQMAETRILGEDDRVELIDGEIVEMTPIGSRHAACVSRLPELFQSLNRRSVQVRVQNPIRLDNYSEPQPDLALVRPRPDFYEAGHPAPGDILLLIEVGDTLAEIDRQVKLPLYARAGIPEVWLVDLDRETITAYLEPAPDRYRVAGPKRRGESLVPAAFPGHIVEVDDVLGRHASPAE